MTRRSATLLPLVLLAACSADDAPSGTGPCRNDASCGSGEICVDGVCEAQDADADAGSGADTGSGADAGSGPDAGSDAGGDAGSGSDAGDDTGTDAGLDADDTGADVDWGPLTWVVSPPDGAAGVPLEATITVEFNQPMNALRFIPSNLTLSSYEDEAFGRTIGYDPDTFTLSLTPPDASTLLPPATPMYFRMAEFIGSESGETLGDTVITRFVTAAYPGTAFHEALAATYAPVVYQEIDLSGTDTFTSFEFDGDSDPTNNLDAAGRNQPNPGYLYWAVHETDTHFFVTYIFYWAGVQLNATETAEHDMAGVQVIAEKTPADAFGRLWAWSTFDHSRYTGWAISDDWYASGSTRPTGEDIAGRVPSAQIEGGRHVPLFVQAGDHEVCTPTIGAGRCTISSSETAPFNTDTRGVVYRVGGVAQRVGDADDDALTYALQSWTQAVWIRRDLTAGDGALFGGTSEYRPPVIDEEAGTERPGGGRYFPATLAYANDGDSFGELPFTWARDEAFPPDTGLWFVDPAWLAAEKWVLPEGASTEYCFNPWLGIDVRNDRVTCTDPDFAP